MSATATNIAELRRMVAEPTTDTYSDAMLTTFIERYPLRDLLGHPPLEVTEGTPPTTSESDDWIDTYDLHAAAADIWAEKAANLSCTYDSSADGVSMSRSQIFSQYMRMSRYHAARRRPDATAPVRSPWVEDSNYIANLATDRNRLVE